jgi:hypothetical protein
MSTLFIQTAARTPNIQVLTREMIATTRSEKQIDKPGLGTVITAAFCEGVGTPALLAKPTVKVGPVVLAVKPKMLFENIS